MDYADIERAASLMADYGRRMKTAFHAYFLQEQETPTEDRFMAYLRGVLTPGDFDSWQTQYDALKRDLAKDSTVVPPFPWLDNGYDRAAQQRAKPVYQLRLVSANQAEIYKGAAYDAAAVVGMCIRDTTGLWHVVCQTPKPQVLRNTWSEPSDALAGYLEFVANLEKGAG